jgi:hypothetical protein
MTDLKRIVRRRTSRAFDHHGRRIIVQLEPGDILAMKEERRKTWVRIAIPTLYAEVVYRDATERVRRYQKRTKELIKAGVDRRTAKRQAREESGI